MTTLVAGQNAMALKDHGDCAATICRVRDLIKSKMDVGAYGVWIKPLDFSMNGGRLVLTAASRFNADFIRATYGNILSAAAKEIGCGVELAFSRANVRADPANINKNITSSGELPKGAFDEFICSETNQFALFAVKKCALGAATFSPLVIYGQSGAGKSMLADLLVRNTNMRVAATTGARFVSDFVRAMRTNAIFDFKDAMRNCDMFVMDDIQCLAGKRASAEEFMSLVSDLIRMKKNVVLTSEIAPSQISGFDKNLVSLLASGLSVDLAPPETNVRERILTAAGVAASAAKAIAARTPANGHIVSGIAKKISAWRELDCGEITESVLEKLLSDVLTKRNTPVVMVKNMCAKLGVSFDAVMSKTRTRAVVFARQKIMAALKMSTDLTLMELGRLVGGRDHASVLYALSQIEKAKQTDMLLDAELRELAK